MTLTVIILCTDNVRFEQIEKKKNAYGQFIKDIYH